MDASALAHQRDGLAPRRYLPFVVPFNRYALNSKMTNVAYMIGSLHIVPMLRYHQKMLIIHDAHFGSNIKRPMNCVIRKFCVREWRATMTSVDQALEDIKLKMQEMGDSYGILIQQIEPIWIDVSSCAVGRAYKLESLKVRFVMKG